MDFLENEIEKHILQYEHPKRIAPSMRYPHFYDGIIFLRHVTRKVQNILDPRMKSHRKNRYYHCIVARHQSVLRRRLGDSDPRLQEQKVINIKRALQKINGIVIQPGSVFSFWNTVGKPSYKDGYVDGMILSNGRVVEGLGGGLCQLSNFLYWIFLHTPVQIIERHHHALDVFQDSGRVLPFGGGATIFFNFIDLKIKNTSSQPLQLKLWITEKYLKGQILSPLSTPLKFHVFEKNHYFIKRGKKYFRFNQIYRETKKDGKVLGIEKITTNFAPVLYRVTDKYLETNKHAVLDFTNR